jgi:hypothetical protein
LTCNCIYNTNTISEYFNLSNEETLKYFFSILLHNKAKILPLIGDIKSLYIVHRDQVMFLKLYLLWNPELSRLVIEENINPPQMKHSKILALSRLKNKHYNKRISQLSERYSYLDNDN